MPAKRTQVLQDHDLALTVVSQPLDAPRLGRFCLNLAAEHPGDLATDLAWLGGDLTQECWQTALPVERGAADGLRWSCSAGLLLMSVAVPDGPNNDPAKASHDAYARLVRCARDRGFPALLRLWNFIPAINRGEGDLERYRRFCLGRNLALAEAGITGRKLCAGTAVGTHGRRLIVHALAGRNAGIPIENPRQVPAYRYPRNYGERSPSFARATAIPAADGALLLLISGTASIVGHETIHPGDLARQLDETVLNLEALLAQAAGTLAHPGLAKFDRNSLLRVYLRDRRQAEAVRARLRAVWPDPHLAVLESDICRRDLMVEIEAVHHTGPDA